MVNEKTEVVDGQWRLKMNIEAFKRNLRGYIDIFHDIFKCHMDVQCGNGSELILSYVTSYISKWRDGPSLSGILNVFMLCKVNILRRIL